MNTDELEAATEVARRRVLEIQAKLHRWARQCATGLVESPVPGRPARRVREATRGNPPVEIPAGRPESTSHWPNPRLKSRAAARGADCLHAQTLSAWVRRDVPWSEVLAVLMAVRTRLRGTRLLHWSASHSSVTTNVRISIPSYTA